MQHLPYGTEDYGTEDIDSRAMLPTLVNMLVWNLVAVPAVLPFIF
jgi:hypothetical protein